jgi:hypothetical protein
MLIFHHTGGGGEDFWGGGGDKEDAGSFTCIPPFHAFCYEAVMCRGKQNGFQATIFLVFEKKLGEWVKWKHKTNKTHNLLFIGSFFNILWDLPFKIHSPNNNEDLLCLQLHYIMSRLMYISDCTWLAEIFVDIRYVLHKQLTKT